MVFEQEMNTGDGNNNMHIFLIIYILFILIFSVVGVIIKFIHCYDASSYESVKDRSNMELNDMCIEFFKQNPKYAERIRENNGIAKQIYK